MTAVPLPSSVRNSPDYSFPQKQNIAEYRNIRSILPVVFLAYAALIPQEARITIADTTIYPWRAVCLALLPWMVGAISSGRLKLRLADLAVFLGGFWMVISIVAIYGLAQGLVRGAALAIDVVLPYLVARIWIRDLTDARRLLVILAPGAFVVSLIMAIESISQTKLILPLASSIFGTLSRYQDGIAVGDANGYTEVRFGLLRASGPFSHPILAGLFLAGLLPLYFSSGIRRWPYFSGLLASVGAVFSVSSIAVLSIVLSVALLGYDRLIRYVSFITWRFLFVFGGIALLFVQFVSTKGLVSLLIRLTLDPSTGYYRLLIWRFGTISVERNPWFGIGFKDYERMAAMGTSIDNYWLLLAVRHGLIASCALLAATIAGVWSLATLARSASEYDRRFATGLAIALFVLGLAGFSVSLFGGLTGWFYMILGLSISVGQVTTPRAAPRTAAVTSAKFLRNAA